MLQVDRPLILIYYSKKITCIYSFRVKLKPNIFSFKKTKILTLLCSIGYVLEPPKIRGENLMNTVHVCDTLKFNYKPNFFKKLKFFTNVNKEHFLHL